MSPAQQLVDALLERRNAGIPFEFAWSVSLDEVRWPDDVVERAQWRQALVWALDEFRDAYEKPDGMPRYMQRVLARPVEGLDARALAKLAAGGDRGVAVLGVPVR